MTGGGSDANFTSAMGVPTLDGLGADGDGAHTLHEYILVSTLEQRLKFWELLLKEFPRSATRFPWAPQAGMLADRRSRIRGIGPGRDLTDASDTIILRHRYPIFVG